MNSKTIVTNLRIDRNDWLQVKAIAAELGMSVNQYVNFLIRDLSQKREFGVQGTKKTNLGLNGLKNLAKIKNKPVGDLSIEDRAIYA